MSMKPRSWEIKADIQWKVLDLDWKIAMTSSEQQILSLLRTAYVNVIEPHLKTVSRSNLSVSNIMPADLYNDALVLLRCLILCRLEKYEGKYLSFIPKI